MICFFLRLALIFIVTFAFIHIAKFIIRRMFNIRKVSEDDPARNYVKQLHQEVDKPFRDSSLVILFLVLVSQFHNPIFSLRRYNI